MNYKLCSIVHLKYRYKNSHLKKNPEEIMQYLRYKMKHKSI